MGPCISGAVEAVDLEFQFSTTFHHKLVRTVQKQEGSPSKVAWGCQKGRLEGGAWCSVPITDPTLQSPTGETHQFQAPQGKPDVHLLTFCRSFAAQLVRILHHPVFLQGTFLQAPFPTSSSSMK